MKLIFFFYEVFTMLTINQPHNESIVISIKTNKLTQFTSTCCLSVAFTLGNIHKNVRKRLEGFSKEVFHRIYIASDLTHHVNVIMAKEITRSNPLEIVNVRHTWCWWVTITASTIHIMWINTSRVSPIKCFIVICAHVYMYNTLSENVFLFHFLSSTLNIYCIIYIYITPWDMMHFRTKHCI